MSFFDAIGEHLFGKDPEMHSKRLDMLMPEQKQTIRGLNEILNREMGQGVEPYSGEMAAGASPLQAQLFDMLESRGGDVAQWGEQALTQDEEYDPEAAREYWKQSFVEPAKQRFREETLPGLREQFAGQGALSSGGFNRAVADAAANMETQLGGKLGELTYQGRQDFRNRQLQERSLGLQTLDQILGEMGAAGQTQRGIEQGGLQEEFQKWQQGQAYNNPWMQYLNAGPTMQQPWTYQTQNEPGREGALFQSLRTMANSYGRSFGSTTGKGMGMMTMASDRRLKRDVEYLDPVKVDDRTVYPVSFRFFDQPENQRQMGVVAQDLQKAFPELVHEMSIAGGTYLSVDYAGLNRKMEARGA